MTDKAVADTGVTVLKLGGSLLRLPDLRVRIDRFFRGLQMRGRPLIVVGGGSRADRVREWQRRFHFDDTSAHWLAIQAMTDNARQLNRLWRDTQLVATRQQAHQSWSQGRLPILDASSFVEVEETRTLDCQPGVRPPVCEAPSLPRNWTSTSDAIAGWISARWPAERLQLLKSCPPTTTSLSALSRDGLIDSVLPAMVTRATQIFWSDLSSDAATSVRIHQESG